MPDPLFQTLFDETAETRWESVSDLRDRARRRERRTRIVLVAAAALAVMGASTGIAVAQLDRSPAPGGSPTPVPPTTQPAPPITTPPTTRPTTPPPSTPPAAADRLGDAVFLRPADAGPGYRMLRSTEAGDWTFEFSASMLDCPQADRPAQPVERAYRSYIRGAAQDDDRMAEAVSRFRAGDASRYLTQVRERTAGCEPAGGRDISVVARDFAGQEAVLVAVDYGDGFTTHHVLVRQGDLLAEFFVKPDLDPQALQELGRAAAARLCAGTGAC